MRTYHIRMCPKSKAKQQLAENVNKKPNFLSCNLGLLKNHV